MIAWRTNITMWMAELALRSFFCNRKDAACGDYEIIGESPPECSRERVSTHLPFSASSPYSEKTQICIKRCINLHNLLHKWGNLKMQGGHATGAAVKDVRAEAWSKWPQEKGGGKAKERRSGAAHERGCAQRIMIAGLSITSSPRFNAHPAGEPVLCESSHGRWDSAPPVYRCVQKHKYSS